jgi:hypothetical protein
MCLAIRIDAMRSNPAIGSTFESFLEEMGDTEVVDAMAARKILAIDVARRMRKLGLTARVLARRTGASRDEIHLIVKLQGEGVAVTTLLGLAGVLGLDSEAMRHVQHTARKDVLGDTAEIPADARLKGTSKMTKKEVAWELKALGIYPIRKRVKRGRRKKANVPTRRRGPGRHRRVL